MIPSLTHLSRLTCQVGCTYEVGCSGCTYEVWGAAGYVIYYTGEMHGIELRQLERRGEREEEGCYTLINSYPVHVHRIAGPHMWSSGFFASEYAIDRNLYERLKFTERS